MIIIGLTGSIGMGKTTTAHMFRELGCPVFDADAVVHNLYSAGGRAVPLIKAVFPDAVKDGAIDRSVLGQHMRRDPLNLQVLESFIHPMVAEDRKEFIQKARDNNNSIIVFDVPLLFETGGDKNVDIVVVVTAPADIQRERVLSRAGINEALFEKLLLRQMPDQEKRRRADYLIYTDKGLDFAREQVQKILTTIQVNK
ncbi:MAG: dephospho-CoA kinase [Maricaulaceae bacterium]